MAAVAQKVSLQLSVQGGSSQDAPCKLSFTVSKAADAPAAADGEVKKRWGDEEAEEPEPVDDAWEVVPSKANKKAKKQQQQQQQLQQQQDAARARPTSSTTKGDSRPTLQQAASQQSQQSQQQQQPAPAPAPQPARRAWDAQPSKPEELSMRRVTSEGMPNGQGAAPSAWQHKPTQATQSVWKGQTHGSGACGASGANFSATNGCSDTERDRTVSDGSSGAAAVAQPRPVQWPALDGVEKPGASGKTPAESASTISVAAMVGAASTACATVIHAAAAASGVVPTPASAGTAAPTGAAAPAPAAATPATVNETASAASESAPAKPAAGGGSWASVVHKNIEKKSDGKAATNTKGFTVLTGPPATCVNSASSAAPAAIPSSNVTDTSTTDSAATGMAEATAASTSDATVSVADNGGAPSSSATDESPGKPANDSAAPMASSAAWSTTSTPACSSTAPPATQQQRHDPPGSSAGSAGAAVPVAPPPARRAWGQNDPRPASLILPKSTDTKSNAAPAGASGSSGASGAPTGAGGAAGGSAQNGAAQNGGASANAGAASYSQAAAPPRPASAPPANDANGKQANMRGGASTSHAGGGGRGGVPLHVPGPYGLQALQAGAPQMNFMVQNAVQNAQALAHYADISGGIGSGEPSDASGSVGAGSSEEHGASHAFDAWVEATSGLQDTSSRGRKNVQGRGGAAASAGRGGRGQGRGQGQQNGGFAAGASGNIVQQQQQQQAQSQQNQQQRQRNARMQQHGSGMNGGGNSGSSYQHMPQHGQQQMQQQQMAFMPSKLHDEIVRFANKNLEACESSHTEVQAIKTTLLHVVTTRWKDARVEMYGSRSTGLYLASSDMDVVLLDIPVSDKNSHTEVGICLKQLHDDLVSLPWVVRQTLIPGARIPVLKILSKNNISVDVTISASQLHTGLQARDLVLGYLHQLPQLAPLVVVLKSFLRDLSLNDVYTGGLSSYCLVVLLFQFMRECENYGYPTHDCGHLLVGFLNNFLWRFESNLTHVDDPLAPTQYADDGITIIRPGENIMHSCYQIGRVCHHFKRALNLLSPEYNDWENTETQLLAQIFGSTRYTQTDEREHTAAHATAGRPTPERHATPDPERGHAVPAGDAMRSPPVLKSPPLTGVAGDAVPAATVSNAGAAGSTAAAAEEAASPKDGAALEESATSKPLAATPAFEVAGAAMPPDAPSGAVSVGGSSDAGEDESAKESAKVLKEMVNSIEAVMPPGTASIGTQVVALDGDLAEPEHDEAGQVLREGATAGDTPSSASAAAASEPTTEETLQPSET